MLVVPESYCWPLIELQHCQELNLESSAYCVQLMALLLSGKKKIAMPQAWRKLQIVTVGWWAKTGLQILCKRCKSDADEPRKYDFERRVASSIGRNKMVKHVPIQLENFQPKFTQIYLSLLIGREQSRDVHSIKMLLFQHRVNLG